MKYCRIQTAKFLAISWHIFSTHVFAVREMCPSYFSWEVDWREVVRIVSFRGWPVKKQKDVNVPVELQRALDELKSDQPQIRNRAKQQLVYLRDAEKRNITDGKLVLFFKQPPLIVSKKDWQQDAVNEYFDNGVRRQDVNRRSTKGVV